MTESSDSNHPSQKLIGAGMPKIVAHYLQLAKLDYLKSELEQTVTTLDRLSQKGLLDPARDYRILSNADAKSLTHAAGGWISKDPNAVLHNNHREWNAADATRWANHIHLETDDLETKGHIWFGQRTLNDAEDMNEKIILRMDEMLQSVKDEPTPDTAMLQRLSTARYLVDGLRSQVIYEQALPSLVSKIYSDLAVAHPARVSAAPSTRKNKTATKWDRSFSDIEGARVRLSASKLWNGDMKSMGRFESCVDELHTVLPEEYEKKIQREHYYQLFNHSDGVDLNLYDTLRVGDLGELLKNRQKHLEESLHKLKDAWAHVTGHPGDFSGLALTQPYDIIRNDFELGIANFGIPHDMILQSNGFDRLSRKLTTFMEGYKYEPETTVFRPSIAQSWLRSLAGLRDQVHDRYDDFLRDNSGGAGATEEGAERTKLLESFQQAIRKLMATNRGAARSLVRENDQASKMEAKYDEKIESL
ncbi:hypothetical protein B9479_008293, partial [Cryptococcus floricola]